MEWFVGIFAFLLLVSSMTLSFMSNTCKQVSDLIYEQNAAANQLGISILDYYNKSKDDKDIQSPPGLLHDLVEFSRRNATIIYTSDRMSISRDIKWVFVSNELLPRIKEFKPTDGTSDQFTHFTINPSAYSMKDLVTEGENQIRLYQVIRDHSQDISQKWQGVIAGITTYLLPVLYAMLGAFLYTFRSWCEKHRKGDSFQSPDRTSRFLMAGIAGIAIGALNDLFPKEVLFSPLALAFIVGYAIDVFTSRLDVLIETLKNKQTTTPPASTTTTPAPTTTAVRPTLIEAAAVNGG
jgi:hypothetical protein